ncbi:MAG TPA: hypothetical protein VHL59_08275, partial [Thermoanaerobaculia bacterium]|nr:hypothetical protein [Thermoanaerobaculia bacterium]
PPPLHHALTSTPGGAFDPAPAADGRIFFTSLEPDGFVVRVLPSVAPAPAVQTPFDAALVPAIPPQPPQGIAFAAQDLAPRRDYGIGRQELSWLSGQTYAPGHRAFELGVRLGDVVGRLDTLLIASLARDDAPQGVALASAWRGWPVDVQGHLYHAEDDTGGELRATWTRLWPQHRLTVEAGANDEFPFAGASVSARQTRGTMRFEQAIRVEVDDAHQRAVVGASIRSGSTRIAARYQHDEGDELSLGGVASSILPRSAYARRILDPALPLATIRGADYDGWRIETNLPSLPFTAFYQRHALADLALSLAGVEVTLHSDPMPILKVPGLDVTLGAARVFDEPLEGDTQWWLAMRWRP